MHSESPTSRARAAARAVPERLLAGVALRLPSGQVVLATHGAIVGRLASCAVHVDEPGISEAHALVSLRAGAFRLLALRGRLAIDGALVKDAPLVPGREIHLTPRDTLRVERVQLPRAVLAIEGDGLPRQALPPSCAIVTSPRLQVTPQYRDDAGAWIWSNGTEWNLRLASASGARPLRDGESFEVDGKTLTTSLMELEDAGGATTFGPVLDLEPLVIEARYDVVNIRRGQLPPVTLVGKPARIVCELVLLGGAADWDVLASEVWDDTDRDSLRRKFDVSMVRLRQKLRASRLRPDLVRPLGTGVVELVLHPRDQVIDAS
ncbi:MAG: hypothetical protein KC635_14240 [Myxococcales bacterium]|nr:hypothetical protein [Myxococcales bacterium]MCB9732557.1 hypothetical protein [Deltaproteobacteria bacterium]